MTEECSNLVTKMLETLRQGSAVNIGYDCQNLRGAAHIRVTRAGGEGDDELFHGAGRTEDGTTKYLVYSMTPEEGGKVSVQGAGRVEESMSHSFQIHGTASLEDITAACGRADTVADLVRTLASRVANGTLGRRVDP